VYAFHRYRRSARFAGTSLPEISLTVYVLAEASTIFTDDLRRREGREHFASGACRGKSTITEMRTDTHNPFGHGGEEAGCSAVWLAVGRHGARKTSSRGRQ